MSEVRLIDAEALKKAITLNRNIDRNAVCDVLDIIDNAPTVPLPDFKEGYKQAILDGKTNFSTPEGKWGKPFDRNGKSYHKCNKCHVSSELTLFDNFCPFCGADMRGKQNA